MRSPPSLLGVAENFTDGAALRNWGQPLAEGTQKLEPVDRIAQAHLLPMLVEPVLVDGVIDDDLGLARTGAQLALVDGGNDHAGVMKLVLVECGLAPVAAEVARVTSSRRTTGLRLTSGRPKGRGPRR